MSGYGTVITKAAAEGICELYVSDDGVSDRYSAGEIYKAQNNTGKPVAPGDVVRTDWSEQLNGVAASAMATRATGNVDAKGKFLSVIDAGDSGLKKMAKIDLSGDHGKNEGFAGKKGVRASNVNKKAAYLSE